MMLRRWLHNRRRKIFRFNDGRRVRAADPIEISVGLADHPVYLPTHLDDARSGDTDALGRVAAAACDVFGVQPLSADGKSGLTVAERYELMVAFDVYMLALKKNTGHSLTRPPSTGSTSPASSGPITSGTSASGATEPAPPSEPPSTSASDPSPQPDRLSSAGA